MTWMADGVRLDPNAMFFQNKITKMRNYCQKFVHTYTSYQQQKSGRTKIPNEKDMKLYNFKKLLGSIETPPAHKGITKF